LNPTERIHVMVAPVVASAMPGRCEALLGFFKAMADESRLRIVGLLAERERSVQELA
jgi:DNA-binding transcriptional ArsR family regulator